MHVIYLFSCTQDVDLEILLSCMHWLWKLQRTYDLQVEYQLKKEARKALYRGYHAMRKMADYLNVPLKDLGKILSSKMSTFAHHDYCYSGLWLG